jgi:hypothetical protein
MAQIANLLFAIRAPTGWKMQKTDRKNDGNNQAREKGKEIGPPSFINANLGLQTSAFSHSFCLSLVRLLPCNDSPTTFQAAIADIRKPENNLARHILFVTQNPSHPILMLPAPLEGYRGASDTTVVSLPWRRKARSHGRPVKATTRQRTTARRQPRGCGQPREGE